MAQGNTEQLNKKFQGELKWIKPEYLISEDEYNKYECFFIGLGVVFNDLKGILLFEKLLNDTYPKPNISETTVHMGNYAGVMTQIQKIVAGVISEFFIYLKKNSDVYNNFNFKEVLQKLPKREQDFWKNLVLAAHGKFSSVNDLLKTMVQIRNNLVFHYDHSGRILRNSFRSYFFGKDQNNRNKYAYFSIGNNIELTRFYFSDAAIQESIFIAAGKTFKEPLSSNESFLKYQKQVMDTIVITSETIRLLLKNYIQIRRNHPH